MMASRREFVTRALAISALAALGAGCAGESGSGEEPVAEARGAQLDPGMKDYLIYNIWQGIFLKGKVLVTRNTGGGYVADREYWYMSSNLTAGASVTFSATTSQFWSTPPSGLGTLSFTTQRRAAWAAATPPATMSYEALPSGQKIGLQWGMTLSHGAWSGSITWWNTAVTDLFGEEQSHTLTPGTTPAGSWSSFTTAPL